MKGKSALSSWLLVILFIFEVIILIKVGVIIMFKKFKIKLVDIILYIVGSLIYAVSITVFISPNKISPGGFTGLATLINYLLDIPTGIVLFLLNIPILIIGFLKFGGAFMLKTALATILLSTSLTFTDSVISPILTEPILASVFGGLLMGLGISIILRRGATTGGVDIIAKLINKKYRHFTIGKIILLIDGVVIILSTIIHKNLEGALYSVVTIYSSSKIMDSMLYGADRGKLIYILTKNPKNICDDINNQIKRGVTILNAVGAYTGNSLFMLVCTVRVHEVAYVYNIIDKYDNSAFVIVTDVGEILGEGFKNRIGM